ncbi:hypothetical protein [Streptomyces sp. NPDC056669]|uniref:hypothetical protein n=1 Tax=Streptomyces sp. NPDC056669 TaxID=3345903 RepID=UPI0036AFF16E
MLRRLLLLLRRLAGTGTRPAQIRGPPGGHQDRPRAARTISVPTLFEAIEKSVS